MDIKWLGHASFLITSEDGVRIVTDPYSVGGGIDYGQIRESADVVTVSHEHADHNNVGAVKGNPDVVRGVGDRRVRGIDFRGIASYHDEARGGQRGDNTVFCFPVDGLRLCHLGDLGHEFSDRTVDEIGQVDILLVPVGGLFTIDAGSAAKVCQDLSARVVIPMHYKTDKCGYPIAGVEDFLKGKQNVRRVAGSQVEFTREQMPSSMEIVVLHHAL